jgi:WD40 repeat protein
LAADHFTCDRRNDNTEHLERTLCFEKSQSVGPETTSFPTFLSQQGFSTALESPDVTINRLGVKMGDSAGYKLSNVLLGHTGDVRGLATTPDGALLSASRDKTAKLWRLDE